MRHRFRSDKDGFSLLEMIIIIAIMAILFGGVALSYNMVRSANTKGTAYDIDGNLTTLKSKNMASNKLKYMHLYRYSGDFYVDYTDVASYTPAGEGEVIGDSAVTITCDGTVLSEGTVVTIGMQKKDGAFSQGPKEIKLSSEDGTTYVVYLIHETGKHYVEQLG